MIVQTMTRFSFREWFLNSETRKDQFSYEALGALFEYLDQLSDDLGEAIEFDPIAFCVAYSEYDNFENFQSDSGGYPDIKSMDDLRDRTTVIEIENSEHFIIENF